MQPCNLLSPRKHKAIVRLLGLKDGVYPYDCPPPLKTGILIDDTNQTITIATYGSYPYPERSHHLSPPTHPNSIQFVLRSEIDRSHELFRKHKRNTKDPDPSYESAVAKLRKRLRKIARRDHAEDTNHSES